MGKARFMPSGHPSSKNQPHTTYHITTDYLSQEEGSRAIRNKNRQQIVQTTLKRRGAYPVFSTGPPDDSILPPSSTVTKSLHPHLKSDPVSSSRCSWDPRQTPTKKRPSTAPADTQFYVHDNPSVRQQLDWAIQIQEIFSDLGSAHGSPPLASYQPPPIPYTDPRSPNPTPCLGRPSN